MEAESHTTPTPVGKAGRADVPINTPTTQSIYFFMSLNFHEQKNLEKIADALTEVFNPEEALVCTPLHRIAHALETIAKSMDSSFEREQGLD